jgi:selenocysteine lyase/cysteine desulfurase
MLHRRELLARAGMLAAASKMAPAFAAASKSGSEFPFKSDFPIAEKQTYLNNAGWHPMPLASMKAMQDYLDFKTKGPGAAPDGYNPSRSKNVKEMLAQLINAKPSEIAYVPSTLSGENIVVAGLGIPHSGGNVVIDALHFEASTYLYRMLEKQGLDLRVVMPRDGRIEMSDMEKVVDHKTKLIAVSLVSYVNGFKHDLKKVADLAHAHGGYVYADMVQAVGNTPVDVRASGVDFAACSSYKWLMGDMGLGYLYVKEGLQGSVLKATHFGSRQYSNFEHHIFPYDRPDAAPATWEKLSGAGSFYEVGSVSNITIACQYESLKYVQRLGVDNILAHAKPMTDRLQKELPKMGYAAMTPLDNPSPIVTFAVKEPGETLEKTKKAGVTVKVVQHQMRISPSVYNDQKDIDRVLNALA